MLLIPKIEPSGNLALDAYSFSQKELDAVAFTLEKSGIQMAVKTLENDSMDRIGMRFEIVAFDIAKLERLLNLKFKQVDNLTKVVLGPKFLNFDGGGGISYRCSRIDTPPGGCETIYANDDREALVKCALIANEKNWLGAVPAKGSC